MGLGKTYVGSSKATSFDKTILVVCQKSKVNDWFNHFVDNHSGEGYIFLNLTNKSELEYFVDMMNKDVKMVGIINYELAFRRPQIASLRDFVLMLDESSLIQNRKAKQTKFILKLKPSNVILLSGTPCSGKYENLWTQAHLLGWDISEDLYNRQYVNRSLVDFGGVKFYQVDKKNPYKNVERLKSKLREYGSVFMKTEEVFDLPEQTFIDVKVQKSKEYKKFMKDSIVILHNGDQGEILVGDTSLTKLLYARQLCSIYSKDKLQAFKDLVESTQDRLIVFYNFKAECESLQGICEASERPVSLVNGSVKDLTNYETESDSVTLVQYQAGAMGLNLQKANKIVFFSPTLRCEHWMQSLKRIHRIGQEKPCFYYKMIVQGSVEEKIYQSLEKGTDYTNELFKKEF